MIPILMASERSELNNGILDKESSPAVERPIDAALRRWLIDVRRALHRNPEVGFAEHRTAAYICERLAEQRIDYRRIGATGIIADLGPSAAAVPCVCLRADMDALPVTERTGLPFASARPGVMHACGHDGHVAMLLGAAVLLQRGPQLPGRVRLLFQPAEERGNGAEQMIAAGVLDGVDAIFAGHIDTHYPTGTITVDSGIICAFADLFAIRVIGRGGHAARPHEAGDAIVAAAGLVTSMQNLVSRETDPNRAAVVTIGTFHAGNAANVIAAEAVLEGTVRCTDATTRQRILSGLQRMSKAAEDLYDVRVELSFSERLPAVINDPQLAEIARRAADRVTSAVQVISQGPSSLGGEDFSFYQQQIPGCLVRFGAASTAPCGPAHSDTFDFDERCLDIGASWLAEVARQWLDCLVTQAAKT